MSLEWRDEWARIQIVQQYLCCRDYPSAILAVRELRDLIYNGKGEDDEV